MCPLKNVKVQQSGTVQNYVMGWYVSTVMLLLNFPKKIVWILETG